MMRSQKIIAQEVELMFLKISSKTVLLAGLFWASFCCASNALAKDSFPLITYECNSAKDFLLITNTLLKDGKEKNFNYSDAEGTYSPWDLVEIKDNNIVDVRSIKKECQLSSAKYTVIIEPQIFTRELDGICGANISTALTILANNIEVMERKAFEFHCSGNTQIITGIKVMGDTGEIKTRTEPRYKYY